MRTLRLFKLVGDETDIISYITKYTFLLKTDWSGIYFQDDIEHAASCSGYRYDQGYKICNLIEITIDLEKSKVALFVVDDKFLADPNISGQSKAQFIKQKKSIPDNILLCDYLAENRLILKCLEFDSEFEYLIPKDIFEELIFEQKISKCYKFDKNLQISELNL